MTPIELSEIQAYLLNDLKEMGYSRYYLLKVKDATAAKKLIASIAGSISNAAVSAQDTSLNIGFTNTGLIALGLNEINPLCPCISEIPFHQQFFVLGVTKLSFIP